MLSKKENVESTREDILTGPILKIMLVLAWPIAVSQIFQMGYNLVDTFWIAKLGAVSVAVPTISWPVIFLLVAISSGLSVAGTSLVSQYTGANDIEMSKKAGGQVMGLVMLASVLISIASIIISPFMVNLITTDPEVRELAVPYFRVIFAGIPGMFMILTATAILRAWGNVKTPMLITSFGIVLNLILDPLLIFGWAGFPEMGLIGAATATTLIRTIGGIIFIYVIFFRGGETNIPLRFTTLKKEWVPRILKIAIPSTIGQTGIALGFLITVGIMDRIGITSLAAYGIGNRLINMAFIITGGIYGAMTTMVGQSLGAGMHKRAKEMVRTGLIFCTLFMAILSLFFYFFEEPIYRAFINDPAVIAEGKNFFTYMGLTSLFFGIFAGVQASFQAAGDTVPPMVMGIIRLWLIRLPLIFFLAFAIGLGSIGVWLGMGISNIISAAMALAWYRRTEWKVAIESENVKKKIKRSKSDMDSL